LYGTTEWQEKVVQAVIDHHSYTEAAKVLGVNVGAVKAVFYKLRNKDREAQALHKKIVQWQKQLGPKKRYLV